MYFVTQYQHGRTYNAKYKYTGSMY